MVDTWVIAVLTYGHIISAIGWLGAVFVINLVIGPLMPRFSPATRLDLLQHFGPRFSRIVLMFAGLTVVFGGALFWALEPGTSLVWKETIGTGILLAAIAFVEGAVLTAPTSFRLAKVAATVAANPGTPPPPEMPKLLRHMTVGAFTGMLILVAALAFMVSAAQI